MGSGRMTPWSLRFSGTKAIPASSRRRMAQPVTSTPSRSTAPDCTGSAPTMARASSVRPAPTRPARPTISPRRTLMETGAPPPAGTRSRVSRTTSPGVVRWRWYTESRCRPTIRSTISSLVVARVTRVPVERPSLRTETRSEMVNTSSSLWVTKMTPSPSERRRRSSSKSRSVSKRLRLAVGSSRMRMRERSFSARAISTSCCWEVESRSTGLSRSMLTPSVAMASAAWRRISPLSSRQPRRSSRPRNMFSTTERCGARLNSCQMTAMPSERTREMVVSPRSLPSTCRLPPS